LSEQRVLVSVLRSVWVSVLESALGWELELELESGLQSESGLEWEWALVQ
jgi:hypothetical protein